MPSSKTDYLLLIAVAAIAYWLGANSQTGSSTGVGTRTDLATGIEFPTTKSFHVAPRSALQLVGVGTRKKAVLNVYSVGLFVSSSLHKQLQEKSGKAVCDTIMSTKSPRTVQLTFAMAVGPEKIAEAVSQLDGVDKEVRKEFHDMLVNGMGDGGKLQKGEVMTFEWKGSDTIHATARGDYLGSVKDQALAKGVMELYIGTKSVSPSLVGDLGCR